MSKLKSAHPTTIQDPKHKLTNSLPMAWSTHLVRFRVQASNISLWYSNDEQCRIRLWDEDRPDALHARGIRCLGNCHHGPLALHFRTFQITVHAYRHPPQHPSQYSAVAIKRSASRRWSTETRVHYSSSTCFSAASSSPTVCSARLPRQLSEPS